MMTICELVSRTLGTDVLLDNAMLISMRGSEYSSLGEGDGEGMGS